MLHPNDLLQLLDELALPIGDVLHAAPVPGARHVFIGKTRTGDVGLLVEHGTVAISGRPTVLRHVRFAPSIAATIRAGEVERMSNFCALWCIDGEPSLTAYFLRVICNLVLTEDVLSGLSSPSAAIETVLELFSALTSAPRKSLQGLWGELYLVSRSVDVGAALAAWHSDPGELFDFVAEAQRVEAKTSATGLRQHVFKLEQLLPAEGTRVFVASLMLQERADGHSLLELVDMVRSAPGINADQCRRIEVVVARTLGTGWRESATRRFSSLDGSNALAFFAASAIPTVSAPLPAEVSDVTFRSDLSAAHPLDEAAICADGGLVRNLAGRSLAPA